MISRPLLQVRIEELERRVGEASGRRDILSFLETTWPDGVETGIMLLLEAHQSFEAPRIHFVTAAQSFAAGGCDGVGSDSNDKANARAA